MVEKVYVTYNEVGHPMRAHEGSNLLGRSLHAFETQWEQVHKLCQASAGRILDGFKPNLMIAIGGGGYVPARILRYISRERLAAEERPLHTWLLQRLSLP